MAKKQINPFGNRMAKHDVTASDKAKHMESGKVYKVNMDMAKLLEARGWIEETGFLSDEEKKSASKKKAVKPEIEKEKQE